MSVTTAIKDYAREKISRLDKYHRGIENVRITLAVEHDSHIAEAVVTMRRSSLVVHVQCGDMYAAIDVLTEKLQRQLRRHKERMADRRTGRHNARKSRIIAGDDDARDN